MKIYIGIILCSFITFGKCKTQLSCSRRRRRRPISGNCGAGTYASFITPCSTRLNKCISCPANKYRADTIHILEYCNDCKAGQNSTSKSTYCEGTICSAGKYGAVGSNICNTCLAGQYSGSPVFTCTKCHSGQYASQSGQEVCNGEKCSAGKYGSVGSINIKESPCIDCGTGKWSDVGSYNCYDCPTGKYWANQQEGCRENSRCSSMYYGVSTSKTSDVTCMNCSDVSTKQGVTLWFSLAVLITNILIIICCNNMMGCVLCFMIWPFVWFMAMLFCKQGPYSLATLVVVILFDIISLTPLGHVIHNITQKNISTNISVIV